MCTYVFQSFYLDVRLSSSTSLLPERFVWAAHASPEAIASVCGFNRRLFECRCLPKRVFSTVGTSAALPRPGTSKWAVTAKQLITSAVAGGSSELELYLLYAWEPHRMAQSCVLIHGQSEDRQGRCCINHSSLELKNSKSLSLSVWDGQFASLFI